MQGFDLEKYQEFTDGAVVPPNFQSMHIDDGIRTITYRGNVEALPFVRRILLADGTLEPARYFLVQTQGGGLDGSGFVLWYQEDGAKAASFAICIHQKVAGPGANPQRGWNPGKCEKCGLDMTTDSSG